ncbi:Protein GLRX-3 b [Aphelenchoides avenae]|nr:Protein GLRX-3 b [Aphelenchus avenae]
MTVKKLTSKQEFDDFVKQPGLNLVHFSVTWTPSCAQLNEILAELAKTLTDPFNVAEIDAEGVPEASLGSDVIAAPTIVYFKDGKQVDRINGFHPTEVKNLILKHQFGVSAPAAAEPVVKEDLTERLKRLINKSRLTLFMKGNREAPRCGFSRQIVEMLNGLNAEYWTFDILSDDEVRQGLKVYSDWPTYPQLYLDGELLGGLDVVREELQNPDFVKKLPIVSSE